MVRMSRVSFGFPLKYGYGMPRYFCEISWMLSWPALVGGGGDPAPDGVEPPDLVGIGDIDGNPRVPGEIAVLLGAPDDVEDDVLTVGVHPRLGELWGTVGHERGHEARAGLAQQVDQSGREWLGHVASFQTVG